MEWFALFDTMSRKKEFDDKKRKPPKGWLP